MPLTTDAATLNAQADAIVAANVTPKIDAALSAFETAAVGAAGAGLYAIPFTFPESMLQGVVDGFIAAVLAAGPPAFVVTHLGNPGAANNTLPGWAVPGDKIKIDWS